MLQSFCGRCRLGAAFLAVDLLQHLVEHFSSAVIPEERVLLFFGGGAELGVLAAGSVI